MGHWEQIRAQARNKRAEIVAGPEAGGIISGGRLLALCEECTGVLRVPLAPGDPLLYGAEALLYTEGDDSIIYYNDSVADWLALFYQVHEFAHLWLHHPHEGGEESGCAGHDLDMEASESALPVGAQRVEGYGPRERREREANVFAREFLLPADSLRKWYFEGGMDANRIASEVGMPPALVYHQLSYALLAPDVTPAEKQMPGCGESVPLDDSQRRAAHVERGPLLIEAGPGTGKTRTLTGRVIYLLERGVDPRSILALTFSNKAAEEMRERIAVVAPEQAPLIWMGTFHAFGLELLSKYGTRIGLPSRVSLLDPVDGLLALERSLASLDLRHYLSLYEPGINLRDILSAVSRAKDELVGPEQYAALAQAMLEKAATPEEIERAERALEVAHVYAFYQQYLEREGLLDFGDLIFRSVTLLKECPDVRDRVRRAYPQVLVDEFQDVNRASGILLRELAGGGSGLWAVGDARQAIYRFRGAAPANMRLFTEDYPNAAVMPLEVNYRSQPTVIETFAGLAPGMRATRGADFTPWKANRAEEGARVYMEIAEDDAAEGEGLSRLIMTHHAEGIAFGEQAVLCRSHTTLARIGAMLERLGVPVLYLGDLFERPEVRDLLSFLELTRGDPGSLLRVARFPEYSVPMADVLAAIRRAKADGLSIVETIAGAAGMEELSERGRAGLSLVALHLEEARGDDAWRVLTRYLFGVGGYLRGLLADGSVEGQQRRLAIFQTLQFAHEQRRRTVPEGEDPVRHFLDYVRRLELFGEERGLRQVPDWAESVDAVRLLTIHASKGLEFRAVYVPVLGNGYFPARKQHESCPPPAGMLPASEEDWHEEEEECLFFVALSRARDALCLSRARRYGRRPSNPSRLLGLVAERLPRPPDSPPTWTSAPREAPAVEPRAALPHHKPRFTSTVLEKYIDCPRRFYYDYMLGLGSEGDEGAYVRFHRSVYRAINHVHDEREAGREVVTDGALARLDEIWVEEEMPGQAHEELYRSQAREMLRRVVEGGGTRGPRLRPKWEVPLTYGRVAFTPDGAELIEEGDRAVRLQRLRTGRVSSREKDQPVYALYHKAAALEYPDLERQVQALYLSTGEALDVVLTERQIETGLARYDEALAGILAGDFHPQPSDRRCPRCPHYFTCPAAEDG